MFGGVLGDKRPLFGGPLNPPPPNLISPAVRQSLSLSANQQQQQQQQQSHKWTNKHTGIDGKKSVESTLEASDSTLNEKKKLLKKARQYH